MSSRVKSSITPDDETLICAPFKPTAAAAFMTQRDIQTRQYDVSTDVNWLSYDNVESRDGGVEGVKESEETIQV